MDDDGWSFDMCADGPADLIQRRKRNETKRERRETVQRGAVALRSMCSFEGSIRSVVSAFRSSLTKLVRTKRKEEQYQPTISTKKKQKISHIQHG